MAEFELRWYERLLGGYTRLPHSYKTLSKGQQILTCHDHVFKGRAEWKGMVTLYWGIGTQRTLEGKERMQTVMCRGWDVHLIQSDRRGEGMGGGIKTSFSLFSQPKSQPPLKRFDGDRYAPVSSPSFLGKGWEGGTSLKGKSCNVFCVDSLKGSWQEIRGCY